MKGSARRQRVQMRLLRLLPLLIVLPAAAIADPSPASQLEGRWYGESYQPSLGKKTQEVMDRRADGTFEIEFRLYENCELKFDEKEAGRWSVNGRIYHTDTLYVNGRAVDTKLSFYHDDYEIERLGTGEFTYRHVKSGVTATSRKVGPDFIFPACGT